MCERAFEQKAKELEELGNDEKQVDIDFDESAILMKFAELGKTKDAIRHIATLEKVVQELQAVEREFHLVSATTQKEVSTELASFEGQMESAMKALGDCYSEFKTKRLFAILKTKVAMKKVKP